MRRGVRGGMAGARGAGQGRKRMTAQGAMTLCAHSARSFEGSRGPPGSPGSILVSHKLPKHGVLQNARLLSTLSELNGVKKIKTIAQHEESFKRIYIPFHLENPQVKHKFVYFTKVILTYSQQSF